ncbi:hypothetical protein [Clostridium intestinale]|uniref:DUF4355 domain-containing protein n=1 Tax=Clostridium intestinale TaxID=36845 RepID=A0A7D6VQ45_9CLOT|nr:hypothetical protein [Clostridium intestinale]QLY79188.1 hypothetical protein HZF06_19235 [Clostridium intestinale]
MYLMNLRRNLLKGKMREADNGGSGGNGGGTEETKEGEEDKGEEEVKTFTQDEVDKLIKDRVAREKKGQLSKEEIKAYQDWKDSQKTDEEKKNEAVTNADKARIAAEERATALEAKVTCLSKGVKSDFTDDVVILAKAMVSDEVTMEQAIENVLKKYPHFTGSSEGEEETNGFKKVGGGKGEQKKSSEEVLKAAFGIK